MKSVCYLLLAALLIGCGSPQSDSKETTDKSTANGDANKSAKGKHGRPKPARVEVPPDAYPGIPAAIDALSKAAESGDSNEIVRTCAWLKMQGDAAVQPLGELLFDESTPKMTRYYTCRALADVGGAAVPLMIKKLDTDSTEVRFGLINNLGRVRTSDQAVNDRITKALLEQAGKDKSTDTRRRAILALAELGEPAGKLAKEPLIKLSQDDDDPAVRKAAGKALKSVAPRRTFVDR